MEEGGVVLIGPNGWPIVVIVVFMSFVGWWLMQSGKPARQGPTFWEGVWWSALKAVFPGVHAWYVSSVLGGSAGENEEEPRVMLREIPQTSADEQTDEADGPSVSADNLEVPRLQLDKTKTTIIEVLVYNGWQAGEIRSVLKGDNGVIGTEVEAARKRLGIDPPERTLKVRDEKGERVIPMTAAPSARANYHHGDPDLEYQNPPI